MLQIDLSQTLPTHSQRKNKAETQGQKQMDGMKGIRGKLKFNKNFFGKQYEENNMGEIYLQLQVHK